MKVIKKFLSNFISVILPYAFAFSIFYEKIFNWHNKYVDNAQILYSIFFWLCMIIASIGLILASHGSAEEILEHHNQLKALVRSQKLLWKFVGIFTVVLNFLISLGMALVGAWFTFIGFLALTFIGIGVHKLNKRVYQAYINKCEKENQTGTLTASYTIVED